MRLSSKPQASYSDNRDWSDQWIPRIREIVGPYLLEPSSFDVDTTQATDLVIVTSRLIQIACRVRRAGYLPKYEHDFTIRRQTKHGAKTEFEKLLNGMADWMFYAHEGDGDFAKWMLINLDVWRREMVVNAEVRHAARQKVPNGDGTYFTPFDVRRFPPDLLIASGPDTPTTDDWLADYERAQSA